MKTNSYPIYIPSKGRAETQLTADALKFLGCNYLIIVEPSEHQAYLANKNHCNNLLVLDMRYKDAYQVLDEHGLSKSTGPGPARNFAWDHAISNGHKWHWVMDDNIAGFARLNNNKRTPVKSPAIFAAMEDFCNRYTNIGMAGPEYRFFAPERSINAPFRLNTRIYSCNLIRNDMPFRWRGRYNEDTILSLDMLIAGYCTVCFFAFLQNKVVTQALAGGNTAEFYAKEGTLPKSKILCDVYPNHAKLIYRYDRWHHYVDYKVFKTLPNLIGELKKQDFDNYGMKLMPA